MRRQAIGLIQSTSDLVQVIAHTTDQTKQFRCNPQEQAVYVPYVLQDQADATTLQDEYGHTVQEDADAQSRSCGF